jgi:preprotein translocase subunit SecD
MSKTKKIFTSFRVILLIVFFIMAILTIHPNPWADGLAIRSVEKNSSAANAGIQSPGPEVRPMAREVIQTINNIPITSLKDYSDFTKTLQPNMTITIKTTKSLYRLQTQAEYKMFATNRTVTETYTEQVFDEGLNRTINATRFRSVPEYTAEYTGVKDLGLGLYDAPTTNLKQGLDLSGGSRVVLKPTSPASQEDISLTIDNINERLNAFGLTDISVRPATNFNGNEQYIIIEIAGATKEELENLAQQGNFEAKIGNATVFRGGEDITYICRTPECSGIDPTIGCQRDSATQNFFCQFRFSISLTPQAAQRQADITKDLQVVIENSQSYLSQSLDLMLDNESVDTLRIGSDLKGSAVTDISISGSGTGITQQEAMNDALTNMKRLQAILATGSLPVQLEIVKADTISPTLGEEFLRNALLIGVVSLLAVTLAVLIRYRSFAVSLPMIIIMVSELIIFLGLAALIGWNLDVAAIAGIIIAIGTGVNDQIVIADETLKGSKQDRAASGWKDKFKSAFFIIFTAYLTIIVAMIPLWFAGAGLLKGFAVTTILGVSVGVFITRPAYAKIVEILANKDY